jgi:two-component system CheB/CheR fusion protein
MLACADRRVFCQTLTGSDGTRTDRPLRVLVVDDDVDTAQSLALLLRLFGHESHAALSGASALASARQLAPDVVFLDLLMPEVDGFEVARQLRQQSLPRKPVLIALTGYGDDAYRRRCADAGFDFHLLKPVEPEDLRQLLAAWQGDRTC